MLRAAVQVWGERRRRLESTVRRLAKPYSVDRIAPRSALRIRGSMLIRASGLHDIVFPLYRVGSVSQRSTEESRRCIESLIVARARRWREESEVEGQSVTGSVSVFGRSSNDGRFTRLQVTRPAVAERVSDGSGFGVFPRGARGPVPEHGPAGRCRRWAGGGGRAGGERRR